MVIDVAAEMDCVLEGLREIEARAGETVRNPAVSAWGVPEHFHHVALVAGSIAMAVAAILRGRGGAPGESSELAATLLGAGEIPRGFGQAPEGMRPAESPDAAAIREAVAKARSRWEKVVDRTEEIAVASARLPHYALGPLTAAEWVRFAAVHGDHHLAIVKDVLAAG